MYYTINELLLNVRNCLLELYFFQKNESFYIFIFTITKLFDILTLLLITDGTF